MLFNSFDFFIFLFFLLVTFNRIPQKFRWQYLLIASFFFYMYWQIIYGLLLLAIIIITYVGSKTMIKQQGKRRKVIFVFVIACCLSILGFFKYYNFIAESLNTLIKWTQPLSKATIQTRSIVLPVGISFFVFQALSYAVDVYKRGAKALASSFGKYALFVSFFPQLVAGPIERSRRMLNQYEKPLSVTWQRIQLAMPLLINGLFKKVVIADNLKPLVDAVFAQGSAASSLMIAIALLGFSIQIYCDFSGYSDMAIAVARMFGIYLMQNFRSPYLATSLQDFWHRWHISLSTWFRDYVYIPLGGNRHKWQITVYRNLFITFVISGLWHGASWNFVIWGGLHGLMMILESLPGFRQLKKIPILNRLYTLLFVYGSWMYFRVEGFSHANEMLQKLISWDTYNWYELLKHPHAVSFILGSIAAAMLLLQEILLQHVVIRRKSLHYAGLRRVLLLAVLTITIVFASAISSDFIYFQF